MFQSNVLRPIRASSGPFTSVAIAVLGIIFSATPALAQPDLVVSSFTPPPTGVEGGIVEISWTVTNQGDTAATGNWSDSIFLSLDQVQSPDEFIGAQPRLQILGPGESYVQTHSIEIPNGVFGDWYFIIETDSGMQIGEGVNEDNNTTAATSPTVIEGTFPDLVVVSIEGPSEVLSGVNLGAGEEVRIIVENVGGTTAVPSTTWRDRFYLSRDEIAGNDDDILLRSLDRSAPVAPGGTYEWVLTQNFFTWPYNINGDWRLVVDLDQFNAVVEGDTGGEENNLGIDDVPTAVRGGDVEITVFTAEDLLTPGNQASIGWTHRNNGPGAINDVRFSLWLSEDSTGGNGETNERRLMNDVNYTSTQQPGAIESETFNFTVPSDVPDGDYFLVLVADPNDNIDENVSPEGESNNVFTNALAIDSNVFPDLVVVSIEGPSEVLSGVNLGAGEEVRIIVENVGGTTAVPSTTWRDRFYLSRDEIAGNDDDILLRSLDRSAPVAPGGTYEWVLTQNFFTWPYNINGDWRLVVDLDQFNAVVEGDTGGEENNLGIDDVPTAVRGGDVEITVFTAEDLLTPGNQASIGWTHRNNGPGAINDVRFSLWLSEDSTGGNGETNERRLMNDVNYTSTQQPGAIESETFNFTVPSDVPDGDYFLVLVADPNDNIDENVSPEGESNNVFATQPISPDLTIADIVIPSGVQIGDEIQLSWTLENAGTKVADGPWMDEIVFSADEILGNEDDLIFNTLQFSGSLTPGQQITRGISFIVPASAAKSAFMIIQTDATDVVNESREDNNVRAEPFEPTGPDLFLASAGVGQSSQSLLEPISVSWVVENQGSAVALGPWVERVYLSSDSVFSPGTDLLLGTEDSIEDIQQGAQAVRSLDLLPPQDNSIAPGDYFVFVDLDSEAGVIEIDEGNNTSAPIAIALTEAETPDLVITQVSGPVVVAAGGTADITWTVQNQGNSPTVGSWSDSIRISLDAAIGNDTEIGRFELSESLNPKQSYTETLTVTIPASFAGTRRFVVATDADNSQNEFAGENNNIAIADVDVEVRTADLVVVEFSAPSSAISGSDIQVQWTARNDGGATAQGAWIDRVYLSDDGVVGPGDILLEELTFTADLASDGTYTQTVALSIPNVTGNKQLILALDDMNSVVELGGEINNFAETPIELVPSPIPDLVILSIMPPANGVLSGSQTEATFDVLNDGTGPTTVPVWSDELFLSLDETLDAGDTRLGIMTNPLFLPQGESYRQRIQFQLPSDQAGQYWVIARADRANQIVESNESNNTLAAGPFSIDLEPQPDLMVVSVSGPPIAFSGEPISVTWTEINSTDLPGTGGPTDAANWFARFYLSENQTQSITPGDIEIGAVASGQGVPLVPGASFTMTQNATLPTIISGDFFIKVEADSNDVVSEFGFEGNNIGVSTATVSISQTPPVDLVATEISFSGIGLPGHVIELTYEAANFGAPPQSGLFWVDAIYLSTDDVFSPNTDTRIATVNQSAGLPEIEPYSQTVSARLANELSAGQYSIFVRIDDTDLLFEGATGEENNVMQAAVDLIVEERYADLLPFLSVSTGEPFPPGHSVDLSWNIKNEGDVVTPVDSWFDAIVFSTDPVLDDTDQTLVSIDRSGILQASEDYTRQPTIELPLVDAGLYYLILVADRGDTVFEGPGDTEANISIVQIEISDVAADLVVSDVANPNAGISGQPHQVTWVVSNNGSAETPQSTWIDSIEIVQEGFPDSIIATATSSRESVLDSGGSYSGSASVMLPISAQGNYMARVRTDSLGRVYEQSEDNNESVSTLFAVTLPDADKDGDPDIANLVASPPNAPSQARTGDTITVSWSVSNDGDGPSIATQWTDRVYLSSDELLSEDDITLGSRTRFGALESGSNYSGSINSTLSDSLIPGDYYLIVQVDTEGVVFENERTSDNVIASTEPISIERFAVPNLVALAVTTQPEISTGQLLEVSWSARNDGEGPPRQSSWSDAVWLSRDQFLGGNDIRIGSLARSGSLAVGESYEQSTSFRIPTGIAGPYFVLAQIDNGFRVNEDGREDDNVVSSSSLIDVAIPDPADLIVASVSPPSMAMLGEQATFTWEVANAEDAASPVTGSWEDSVFLSEDEYWDIDDAFVGRVTTSTASPLDPGMSVTGSITAPVPGVRPGEYFVIVRSDSRNLIPETNDLNNDGNSIDTVSVEATPLTLGVPFTGDFPSGVERYFQVDVQAGETLRFTYTHDDPNAFTELYVAFERVPTIGDFDALFDSPSFSTQFATIPATMEGTYFVLARTFGATVLSTGSLVADALPFQITDFYPARPGADVVTIIIDGARLTDASDLSLISEIDGSEILPLRWVAINATSIRADFDLVNREGEIFRIVTNSNENKTKIHSLPFVISPVISPDLLFEVTGSRPFRPGDTLSGKLVVTNTGNINTLATRLSLFVTPDVVQSGSLERNATVIPFNYDSRLQLIGAKPLVNGLDAGGRMEFDYTINIANTPTGVLTLFAGATAEDEDYLAERYFGIYYDDFMAELRATDSDLALWSDADFEQLMIDFRPLFIADWQQSLRQNLSVTRFPILGFGQLSREQQFQSGGVPSPDQFCDIVDEFIIEATTQNVCDRPGRECLELAARVGARYGLNPYRGVFFATATAIFCSEVCSQAGSYFLEGYRERNLRCEDLCSGPGTPPTGVDCFEPDPCATSPNCTIRLVDVDNPPDGCPDVVITCKPPEDRIRPDDCGLALYTLSRPWNFPCREPVRPTDPNELIGPDGSGLMQYVNARNSMEFRALFENLPSASSPATTVRVQIPLPAGVSAGAFRVSNIGFGDLVLDAPDNRITFQDAVNSNSPQGTPLRVDVFGGVNLSTDPSVAFWVLQAIDESTGEPPLDPFDGFLPPNNPDTGSGEGFIDFSLRPAPGVVTGDVIELQAEIIFDNEEPILTNTVFNTIDADRPVSTLSLLPLATLNPEIPLSFSGIDPAGSGLLGVQLLVSVDNGPLSVFVPLTQDNAAVFDGEPGHVYKFRSQAIDKAGNIESIANAPSQVVAVPTLNLAIESDTGDIGDGRTLDRTPTFEIVSVPFSAVPISISGPTNLAGTIFTDAIGRGTYTVPDGSALPDGLYSIETDNAGVILQTMIQVETSNVIEGWSVVSSHGNAGDAAIPVNMDGTTTEPRSMGILRLELVFSSVIDQSTFNTAAVSVTGLNVGNEPIDLSGVSIVTAVTGSGDVGTIAFSPSLPDLGRYCISINGVLDAGGNEFIENTQIQLTAIRGDVNNDRRVNGADVAFVRAIRDQVVGPFIDVALNDQIRSDVTADGRVNGADVSFVRSLNGNDVRTIQDPCPLPLGEPGIKITKNIRELNNVIKEETTIRGLSTSGANSIREDSEAKSSESQRWQRINTPFAADGTIIRLDPEKFVVGHTEQSPLSRQMLINHGVDSHSISALGYSGWLVVEANGSDAAALLRRSISAEGFFTTPVLRDENDEFLIAKSTVLIRFDESLSAEQQESILLAELGDSITSIEATESVSQLWAVEISSPFGEDSINLANRFTSRKDVVFAEPDFIMFANRVAGRSGSAVDPTLTAPMLLEPPMVETAEGKIDVVMLDDGLLLSAEMLQGETVFGGVNTMGEPETLADVFGQAVFGGLSVDGEDTDLVSVAIRGMASLNSSGRSVTTTLALAQSLDRATQLSPKIVAISAATGFQSKLLNTMEAKMLREGIVLIRSTAFVNPNADLVAQEGALLQVSIYTADENGVQAQALETADRIGKISATLIAADGVGSDVSLAQLARAVAQQLETDSVLDLLTAEALPEFLDLIGSIAERTAIDLNGDGQVTKDDFVLFVKRFELADESADLDGNGQIDQNDMVEYLQRFEIFMAN
ncbi:MAG: CARDB domain-containing protein [Phycisphaerales bacterium]